MPAEGSRWSLSGALRFCQPRAQFASTPVGRSSLRFVVRAGAFGFFELRVERVQTGRPGDCDLLILRERLRLAGDGCERVLDVAVLALTGQIARWHKAQDNDPPGP